MFKSFQISTAAIACGLIIVSLSNEALAQRKGGRSAFAGGSLSFTLGISATSAEQTGLNSLINTAQNNTGSTASKLSSASEYIGAATFRFSNNFLAIQLRPTLFSQSSSGTGSDGNHSYKLDGYTIFPLVRIIPLSNNIIDFYMQAGLGYGKLSGSIRNGNTSADFEGSAFGMQVGMGAEFCFIPSHCLNIEGNYRYMPISRNIVTSASGLPTGVSQATTDLELESGNSDVATTLSGISGIIGYTYNF